LVTAVDAARLAGEAGTGLAGLPPGPACAEGGGARRWRPDLGARRGPGAGDGGVLRPGPATPARRRMTGGIQPEDRMTTTGPGSGPEPLPASAAARAGTRRRLARGARAPAPARALAAAGIDRRGRPAHGTLALPGAGARGLLGLAVRHPGVRLRPRRLHPALGRDHRGVVPAVPVAVRD